MGFNSAFKGLSWFAVAIPQLTTLFIVNMTSSLCVSVTLRFICVTIVAVAKQKVYVCVCARACMRACLP